MRSRRLLISDSREEAIEFQQIQGIGAQTMCDGDWPQGAPLKGCLIEIPDVHRGFFGS